MGGVAQNEDAASVDFARIMAGGITDHVIAYCRRAVCEERKQGDASAADSAAEACLWGARFQPEAPGDGAGGRFEGREPERLDMP